MKNQEGKIRLQKKYIEEFVPETSLFWLHALLSMLFFAAFFVYNIAMDGILCDDIMRERFQIWKSFAT